MTELSIIDYITDAGTIIAALQRGEDVLDRYRQDMERARGQIAAMMQEVQTAGSELAAAWESVKVTAPLQNERQALVQSKVADFQDCGEVALSTLDRYMETAQLIGAIAGENVSPAYVYHRKEELLSQNNAFNYLFDQISFYATQIVQACEAEVATCRALVGGEAESDVDQELLLVRYESYIRYHREIMSVLRDRMHFISTIIESVRTDVVSLRVQHVESDVQDRQEAIKQKRYNVKVDDVKDYEDLEGQYRHQYDEQGNHVDTIEGGDGRNKAAIYTIFGVIALVILVVGVHYLMTH